MLKNRLKNGEKKMAIFFALFITGGAYSFF